MIAWIKGQNMSSA